MRVCDKNSPPSVLSPPITYTHTFVFVSGSISNIDGAEYHCNKTQVRKVISGVVGAASSVTSIQVANLLRLFKIPQVRGVLGEGFMEDVAKQTARRRNRIAPISVYFSEAKQ